MDISQMPSNVINAAAAGAAAGAGAWHLIRPFVQPYINKGLGALPAYFAAKARAEFSAAVKAGKVPPAAVRLLSKYKRATLEWANEELANGSSADQAAAVCSALAQVPVLSKFIAADPDGIRADVALELDAVKAEVKPAP